MRRHGPTLLLVAAIACSAVAARGEKFRFNSYLGQVPPEIVSEDEHWLSAGGKVTLEQLRGKLVWLQYNF